MKVIIIDKRGRFANRLIVLFHWLAFAIEHNHKLFNPNFDEFVDSIKINHPLVRISFSNYRFFQNRFKWVCTKLLPSLNYRLSFILKDLISELDITQTNDRKEEVFDLNKLKVTNNDAKILLTQGWSFRCFNLVEKYADLLRETVTFNQNSISKAINILQEIDQFYSKAIIIGIHVRRGDYKYFRNGEYFYDLEKYEEIIEHISKFFKNIVFIICSDEETYFKKNLTGLTIYECSKSVVEDFYLLSKCDCIVGPPSTFSLSAAFLGKSLIYHIETPNILPSMSDFKVPETL